MGYVYVFCVIVCDSLLFYCNVKSGCIHPSWLVRAHKAWEIAQIKRIRWLTSP